MAVVRVIEADDHLRAWLLEGRDLRRREREPDELHRRGLAVGVGVFPCRVGFAADLLAGGFDKGAILDAAEPGEGRGAESRVVDLEHHRRDKLATLRNQRVVGLEFIRDLRIATLLAVEHLLDLLPHRREILEIEGRERTDFDPPPAFQLGYPAAPLTP